VGSAEIGTLLAFVLPLGLDSFAVAAAAGAAGLTGAARWRLSALLAVFEAGMPLVGLALGVPLAHVAGAAAGRVAALVLIVVGGWMLFSGDAEEESARSLAGAHGLALLGIGASVSLDELAIGFSLGASPFPVTWVVVAIGVQAFIAAQLGVRLGARLGEHLREGAERLAGLALTALGVFLLIYPLAR
jgi:manganese efflux pump family protein